MTAVVSAVSGGGTTGYHYGNNTIIGGTGVCGGTPNGLFLEMVGASSAWNNSINVAITFATPVCAPVTFTIFDINEDIWYDGVSTNYSNYCDQITIGATDPGAVAIAPANISYTGCAVAGNISTSGNNRILRSRSSSNTCSCASASVTINGGGQMIKTINILYNNAPPTYAKYGICQFQNVVLSSITAAPPPTASITAAPLACGSSTTTLTANTSASSPTYQWTGPGGSSIASPNAASTSVTGAGTYTLTINPGGCSATATYTLTPSGTPPNVSAAANQTVTCSATTITASSSTPGVTFSWAGPGIVSGGSTPNPVVNTTGTYTVTVTNPSNGCTNSAPVNVTLNKTLPNAAAGTDKALTCAITSVVLNGSSFTPGVTFSWAGPGIVSGGGTATPTVNAAGTYTLTVTDPSNGCSNTDQAVVTSSGALPNAAAGSDKVLTCAVTSVVLNGSSSTPGATFSWAGPGIVSGGGTATPTVNAAGTYTLTVTDPSNGCSNTDQAVVTSSGALPNAAAGSDKVLTCAVTSVVLNGSSSTPGATFSWAGPGIVSGGGTATPSVNAAGTYTLTVTDPANGCSNTDQAIVTSSGALPNAAAGSDKVLTCAVTSVVLHGSSSTPSVTFSWAGPGIVSGGGTATPSVNAAGTYTLTVTDPANGCSNTDQAIVTSSGALPNAAAGSDKVLTCAITTVVLNGSSSTPSVTFSWAGPGIVSGGGTATPTVNAAGTYTLTVTDPSNGCSNTDQAVVTSSGALPNAAAGTDKVLTCAITSVVLNGSSSTPSVTFSWAGPGIVSGGGTATPSVNAAGTYTLTVTDPANGCSNTDQAVVTTSVSLPNAAAGSDKVLTCAITSVALNGSSSTPGATFSWAGPGIVSGGGTATPTVNSAGTYTLTVTDPSNGCSNTDQAVVTSSGALPNAAAGSDKVLTCAVTSVVLNGSSSTPGATFSWAGPGIVSGGGTATPTVNAAGTYTLTVNDPSNGCSNTDQAVVTQSAPFTITANISENPCPQLANGSINISVSGGTPPFQYAWSGGDTLQDLSGLFGGQYDLQVTDAAGCSVDTSFIVAQGIFEVEALQDTTINLGESTQLLGLVNGGSGLESFSWSPGGTLSCSDCPDPVAAPPTDIVYVLTVTDTNGCADIDSVKIIVNEFFDLYIPNVFTPNEDGDNDRFEVMGNTEAVTSFELWVFNRWNETVFFSNDIHRGWDGVYEGILQDPDVFIYAMKATFLNGETKTYKGILVLLR